MTVAAVYTRLYGDCLFKALRAIRKSLWTLVLPAGVGIGAILAIQVVGGLRLGLIGGIVVALLFDALFSAYLYFVGELVSGSKVSLAELKRSFGAYFWSIVSLMFVIFIARFLLSALMRGPQGALLYEVLALVAFIAFNAAPEVIYQRGTHGGLQTLQESWAFLKENWLPWFLPNAPLFLVLILFGQGGVLSTLLVMAIVLAPVLHVVFVFRGFLFKELAGTSHRQRMFRYKNATS
jgi:hypothetical protein